jgi:tRNA(Ile)-lysidine synthase
MENLLTAFQESLRRLGLKKTDRLLLAVSGGLDSVVLTACAAMSGLDFGIAHMNFRLRGPESERDESFAEELAKRYGKPFFCKKVDTVQYAEVEKVSIQTAARNLRYNWFKTLMGRSPAQYHFLLTAHHLDDQIETMLMHFFRGTGISGLTGMPEKNDYLIRPLLQFSKSNLKEFALSKNLSWVEDSSNASDDYTRNYFRNQLIPSVAAIFPEVIHNLEKNLIRFSEANTLYDQAIALHKKKLLSFFGSEIQIPILLLKKSSPMRTILFEILKEYHFTPAQTDEVIRLFESVNGKYVSSPSHRIIKNRSWLVISPNEDTQSYHIVIEQDDSTRIYPGGRLLMKHFSSSGTDSISRDPSIACLDAGKLQFPLLLRKWKAGDYFYPLGMNKKKKLARFFIDQKLSKTEKEKQWVLISDKKIIWVVGHRIDNRFLVTHSTKDTLRITNEPNIVK